MCFCVVSFKRKVKSGRVGRKNNNEENEERVQKIREKKREFVKRSDGNRIENSWRVLNERKDSNNASKTD